MFTQIVVALVVVALMSLYVYLTRNTRPAVPSGKKLPPVASGLESWVPFFGSAFAFGKNPFMYAYTQYKKYGDIFTLQVMGNRITFLVGPAAQNLFFKGTDDELNQEEPYKFSVPIFGPGVVYDVPLKQRNEQMRILLKVFSAPRLRAAVPLIQDETEQFIKRRFTGNEGVIDIKDELAELIILTAARTLMGKEIRENLHDKVAHLYQVLDEGLTPLSVLFPYAPIPAHKRRDQARLQMVDLFAGVMKQRENNPSATYDDALNDLMTATYKEAARKLTPTEVAGLMIALLFAGQHTSSVTSSWTGLFLAHNPQFMNRAVAEQTEVLAKYQGELNFQAVQDMEMLHRSIKEALRIHPPLIMIMRKALVSFEYNGYFIPKGDTLFASPPISHRVESVFPNPEKFDPDRYLPPRSEDVNANKETPYNYVGFGGGRHECMGQAFAMIQIKVIWSTFLKHFEWEPVGPMPPPDYSGMVVGPSHPAKLRYRRRVPTSTAN